MKKTVVFLFTALLAVGFSGCLKESTSEFNCQYDACAVKAPAAEIAAVREYLTSNNLEATEHCSGLFYRVETEGTGKRPEACLSVRANYKGMFISGQVFDQSQNPIVFSLAEVIRGWTNGVPLIKEGGRIHLYIPPSLGYGPNDRRDAQGNVVIPGNSILIFEVDLIAAQ